MFWAFLCPCISHRSVRLTCYLSSLEERRSKQSPKTWKTKSLFLQWMAVSLQSTSSTPWPAHCHFRSLGEAPWTNCFFSSGHAVQHIAFATISPFISEINYTPVSPLQYEFSKSRNCLSCLLAQCSAHGSCWVLNLSLLSCVASYFFLFYQK